MYMSYRTLISCDLGNLAHISRTECNIDVTPETLTATDTCVGYHVTRFEASGKRYPSYALRKHMCGSGSGRAGGTKIKNLNLPSLRIKVPDHVYEWPKTYTYPVISSLKMEGIRFFLQQRRSVFTARYGLDLWIKFMLILFFRRLRKIAKSDY
jgi:hypothetical protein